MRKYMTIVVVLACVSGSPAEVVVETVPVGNIGNPGEWSGASVPIVGATGGFGADRICGSVDYPYEIAKYEITSLQYCEFLNAVAASDPYSLIGGGYCNIVRSGTDGNYTYAIGDGSPEDIENWGSRPVGGLGWVDAARFANWMHNGQPVGPCDATTTEDGSYTINGAVVPNDVMLIVRNPWATWVVPSEDEWYKAAYHKNDGITANYWNYPTCFSGTIWGGETPDNNVIDPDPGNSACFHIGTPDDDCINEPYYAAPVGEFENSASPYGTFDQGGNVWEWTDTRYVNEAGLLSNHRVIRGGSYYPSIIGNQPDGFMCMHSAYRGHYLGAYGYGRYGMRLAKVANDCNNNEILDQEELAGGTAHDYNYNGVLDACDIAHGTSLDCNTNGIPDEAEVGMVNPPPYFVDDGVPAADSPALGYPDDSQSEGYLAWLNQFSITARRETIGAIVPACLVGHVPIGTPFTVYLWSDPNGDGNPADAQVLASAETTMTTTESIVDIPDTYVGPEGTKFFVGAIMHITDVEHILPASYDDSSDHRSSWMAYGVMAIDPNNLGAAEGLFNLDYLWGWGNFMVRALPAIMVTQLPDLNHNGIPDDCEICATQSGDLDGDNDVDGADIQGFVTCFLQGPGVLPGCMCADMNTPQPDGVLDELDVTLFVNHLLGP